MVEHFLASGIAPCVEPLNDPPPLGVKSEPQSFKLLDQTHLGKLATSLIAYPLSTDTELTHKMSALQPQPEGAYLQEDHGIEGCLAAQRVHSRHDSQDQRHCVANRHLGMVSQ